MQTTFCFFITLLVLILISFRGRKVSSCRSPRPYNVLILLLLCFFNGPPVCQLALTAYTALAWRSCRKKFEPQICTDKTQICEPCLVTVPSGRASREKTPGTGFGQWRRKPFIRKCQDAFTTPSLITNVIRLEPCNQTPEKVN